MTPVLVTLNDLEGHSPVVGNPSNICAVFYQTSTDSALARSLSDSWASCTSYVLCGLSIINKRICYVMLCYATSDRMCPMKHCQLQQLAFDPCIKSTYSQCHIQHSTMRLAGRRHLHPGGNSILCIVAQRCSGSIHYSHHWMHCRLLRRHLPCVATLARYMLWPRVRLSVRPHVRACLSQAGVLSKRLNTAWSRKQRYTQ